MKKGKASTGLHCTVFFARAKEYRLAADILCNARDAVSSEQGITDEMPWHPIYFLYSHATECALKAYLRTADGEVQATHNIFSLYRQCVQKGLKLVSLDQIDANNMIGFLQSGNEDQGFRYLLKSDKTSVLPEFAWARDFVSKLILDIEPSVSRVAEIDLISSKAVSIQLIVSKPVSQK
jgi:hypothetical protein